MEKPRRFTLLPFPQRYDGGTLTLNIVVMPRNQNPFNAPIVNYPGIPNGAAAFAEAKLSFEARIVSSLSAFPFAELPGISKAVQTAPPAQALDLFQALANNFKIKDTNPTNEDLDNNWDKAKKAVSEDLTVKKYLPVSYRQAFNFTTPRHRNAVTDDSYHCAVRDAGLAPGFKRSPETISWGKVFAFALRHPLLAEQLGMIYKTEVDIVATDYPQGGWLYIDLAPGSDYLDQHQADAAFIKRYAARIPPLKPAEPRHVFAPLLFPVLYKENPGDPDPAPVGNYDNLFIETAAYDDGFAKIVHSHQPRSRNLLAEQSDGAHPVKDVGIRLGWDDEQILIWQIRQMMIDPDAPFGVLGYAIDVREANPANPWTSLNMVQSKETLTLDGIPIGDFQDELPYQVYPSQLDGHANKSYWLPMYFANWNGQSMVLPDGDAAAIYRTTSTVQPDPDKTGVTGPAQNRLNEIYDPGPNNVELRYGRKYEFRVRLKDLSGGGTPTGAEMVNETASNIGKCDFKRYVSPSQLRINELPFDTDAVEEINVLNVRRPLIGYPAARYIPDKYANPIARLIDASQNAMDDGTGHAFGISDPDVNRVEVTVEVQTLKMDNLLSVSGKDNYVHLYTTKCAFPPVVNEDDFDATLTIPISYVDCPVLHTGDDKNLAADLGLPANTENLTEIILPTARTIRLTLRALCEDKVNNEAYYGLMHATDRNKDVRYGHILELMAYKSSTNEEDLFTDAATAQRIQGIFLQPDPPQLFDGTTVSLLIGKKVNKPPVMIQRLARQLDLECTDLTLNAPKGERVQFGCSSRIRHTLAPESSSLTFSSKGDLMNHWLCCLNITIDRDWTWDALEDRAFIIKRTKRFTNDKVSETETAEVGDIEIRRTASFEALQDPNRNFTRLIFIDAVEPKTERKQPVPNHAKPRFPDTIEVTYSIEPKFKAGNGVDNDGEEELEVKLPITTNPTQIPRIASAGIALSPYSRNEKYSATEPRRRFLWIEFQEPVEDPNDTYFARVLAYAPDQLISNNNPELFVAPEEPSLPIDPEYIRVVPHGATNDLAGLKAMQPMIKAKDSKKHYLLPLPPGLHGDADDMFGFFTYEFRVGHHKDAHTPEKEDMVWCTAQGRFGRPLRATGIQHPAPTLTCMVNRDEEKIWVSAPYAVAVFGGKNVTADPPRTKLWCLLYAQVRQADNKDFRNILLDDKQLDWRVQVEKEKDVDWLSRYDLKQRNLLKDISLRNSKDEIQYAQTRHVIKLADFLTVNKDATKYGTVVWTNKEVVQLLKLYGLPTDSPLSVLVVEILPTITNFKAHIPDFGQQEMLALIASLGSKANTFVLPAGIGEGRKMAGGSQASASTNDFQEGPSPLNEALGHHRILRTSPLTEVPFVCCSDCD